MTSLRDVLHLLYGSVDVEERRLAMQVQQEREAAEDGRCADDILK